MWWLVLRSQSTTSSGHGFWVQLPLTTGLSLSSITLNMDYHKQLFLSEKKNIRNEVSMHIGLILIKCD